MVHLNLSIFRIVVSFFFFGSIAAQADPVSDKILEIEKNFWMKKKQECIWKGAAAAGKLAVTGGIGCAALAAAGYLKSPVMGAYQCLIGSAGFPENCANGSLTRVFGGNSQFLIAGAASTTMATLGAVAAGYSSRIGNFAYENFTELELTTTRHGWRSIGLSPEVIKLSAVRDQLQLKYELLKEFTVGGQREVDRRYSVINVVIAQLTNAIKNREGDNYFYTSVFFEANRPTTLTASGEEIIQILLAIPIRTKPVQISADQAKVHLSKFFRDTFDEQVVDFFDNQIERVIDNSKLSTDSPYRDRTNIYLMGPGGTGKSDSAMAFAQAFGLPFCKIEASNLVPSHFVGATAAQENNYRSKIGKILECIVTSKSSDDGRTYKNVVIFIDEMDHIFNSKTHGESFEQLFKPLLSGGTFLDQASGIEIDTSDIIFIGAGNGPLLRRPGVDRLHVDAMNRRFSIIEYKKLDFDKRVKVGVHKFLKDIAEARGYLVTPEDRDYVAQTLVPYDHERSDGVGGLSAVINSFVIHRKGGRSFEDFDYRTVFSRTKVSGEVSKSDVSTQTEVVDGGSRMITESEEEDLRALDAFKRALLRGK